MKITELIVESGTKDSWASDFNRYRKMGQEPSQLVTHVAKKAMGTDTENNTASASQPRSKTSLGNTTEIKTILDNVIAGKQLDSQSLEALKQFRRKL